MQTILPASPLPRGGRPVLIVWLFVGIVICLLGLTVYSSQLLSAGRALVGLESAWAKAQKDAVFHLTRFATHGSPEDLKAFEGSVAVIEAERAARGELRKAAPNFATVRHALVATGVHPGDVEGLGTLYSRLSGFGPMAYVVSQWDRSDRLVDQLIAIGDRMRAVGGNLDPAEASELIKRVHRINNSLAPLEEDLAQTLAAMQRTAQSLLTSGILVVTGVLLIGGITLSRRFLLQNERLQQTLAENESQLRHLVEGAPLPLLIVRARDQQLIYANERALEHFDLDFDSARSRSLAEFHVDDDSRASLAEALSRHGVVRDFEVLLKGLAGRESWVLLSAQPMRYAGALCLMVALADIDDRKRVQEDMRRKAMHDPLTGLPNRAMFLETLERAMHKSRRRSARFALLFVDLDRFKEVNDTMGHHAGDALLQVLAERLGEAVRQSDLVARLGGDEFVVLIEAYEGAEEVMIVAQKVLGMLARPVPIDWREAEVSGSIGIAMYPEDGTESATLMKNADAAMYQAKERGRNNFQFYSAEMNRLSDRRREQEKRMLGALDRDEFFLEYQPERDLASGRVVAVEALLRWRDPAGEVLDAEEFMPLAEETGTAPAIGLWAIDTGLAQLARWPGHLSLAVDLTPRQLHQHDIAEEIGKRLQAHGIAPARLRLEVTEPTLTLDSEAVHRAVRVLEALGVELALDHFGTGLSSLGLLRGLPLHVVKIDRTLATATSGRKDNSALIQSTASMAHALGIRIVAEGVDTEEQRRAMQALGCDGIQGYVAGPPTDADGIAAITEAVAEQTFFA